MTPELRKKIEAYIGKSVVKRAKRQCSTGNLALDEGIRSFIMIGYEDGARDFLNLLEPLIEALEFYENSNRLMLDVRDMPKFDDLNLPRLIKEKSIMDNGNTARLALAELEKKLETK